MTRRLTLRNTTAAFALIAAGWVGAASPAFAASTHDDARPWDPAESAQPTPEGSSPNLSRGTPDMSVAPRHRANLDYTRPAGAGVKGQGRIPATPVAVPAAAAPGQVRTLLREADGAIAANHLAIARERLERAETMMLNARVDGEQGYQAAVRDIASARAAVAMGNQGVARQDLGRAIQALDTSAN